MSPLFRNAFGAATAGALVLTSVVAVSPAALADQGVTLTSKQLTAAGFPLKPNVAGWTPGTANLPTNTAAQWDDVIITGKAPKETPIGQILTMSRYVPQDANGNGTMKQLNITAVVQKDRSYTLHFQLGMPGNYGYAVGYETSSASPEFIGFQFQFKTTGSGEASPSSGSANAVQLNSKQLARGGFTKSVNVEGWGGTGTISTNVAKAGSPVTVKGTAPSYVKPGTLLTLQRFVATDKSISGSFEPVPGAQTVVGSDGTYSLTFEINQPGLYGYTLGANGKEEWIGMEFQLRTT